MPIKPLHISMRKIEIYERHRASKAQMEAGGPSPMEETKRFLDMVDPTGELTVEHQRQTFLAEEKGAEATKDRQS